jgi:hypothetical protein
MGAGFVDKNQAIGIYLYRPPLECSPLGLDIRTILFRLPRTFCEDKTRADAKSAAHSNDGHAVGGSLAVLCPCEFIGCHVRLLTDQPFQQLHVDRRPTPPRSDAQRRPPCPAS